MSSLKLGIEVVTKATEHDTNKRYPEAIYLYTVAIDLLQKALQGIVHSTEINFQRGIKQ